MPDSGETRPECPICLEEMDSTDIALLPCPCDYQVCLWCLRRIMQEENNRCPQCRREYNESQFRHSQVKLFRCSEPIERKSSNVHEDSNSSKQLGSQSHASHSNDNDADGHREFVPSQHNTTGSLGNQIGRHPTISRLYNWPHSLLNAQVMSQFRYFGKYGRLLSIAVAKQNYSATVDYSHPRGSNSLVFITYASAEQATLAQQDIAKFTHRTGDLAMRNVRFHVGAARHCIQFIRGAPCSANDKCPFVHSVLDRNSSKYFWKNTRNTVACPASSLTATWWLRHLAAGEAVHDAITSSSTESFFGKSVSELLPTLERLGVCVPSNAVSLESREISAHEGSLRYSALARESVSALSDTDETDFAGGPLALPKKCWRKRPSAAVATAAASGVNDPMFPSLGASLRLENSNKSDSTAVLPPPGVAPVPCRFTGGQTNELALGTSAGDGVAVPAPADDETSTQVDNPLLYGAPLTSDEPPEAARPGNKAARCAALLMGRLPTTLRPLVGLVGLVCIPPPPPCRAEVSPLAAQGIGGLFSAAITPAARISHARVTPPPLASYAMVPSLDDCNTQAINKGLFQCESFADETGPPLKDADTTAATSVGGATQMLDLGPHGKIELDEEQIERFERESATAHSAGVMAASKRHRRKSTKSNSSVTDQNGQQTAIIRPLHAAKAATDAGTETAQEGGCGTRQSTSLHCWRPTEGGQPAVYGEPQASLEGLGEDFAVPRDDLEAFNLSDYYGAETAGRPVSVAAVPRAVNLPNGGSGPAGASRVVFPPPASIGSGQLENSPLRLGCSKRGMKVFLPPPGLGSPNKLEADDAPTPNSILSEPAGSGITQGRATVHRGFDIESIGLPRVTKTEQNRGSLKPPEKSADEWAADILGQCLQDFECGDSKSFFWDDLPPLTGRDAVRPVPSNSGAAPCNNSSPTTTPRSAPPRAQHQHISWWQEPPPEEQQYGESPHRAPSVPMAYAPSAQHLPSPSAASLNSASHMHQDRSSSDQKIAEWLSGLLSQLNHNNAVGITNSGGGGAQSTYPGVRGGLTATMSGEEVVAGAPRRLHGSEFDYMTGRLRVPQNYESSSTMPRPSYQPGGDSGYRSPMMGGYDAHSVSRGWGAPRQPEESRAPYSREAIPQHSLSTSRGYSGHQPANPMYWAGSGCSASPQHPKDLASLHPSGVVEAARLAGESGAAGGGNDWMRVLQAICPNSSVTVAGRSDPGRTARERSKCP